MKKLILLVILTISLFLLSCSPANSVAADTADGTDVGNPSINWRNIDLADVATGQTFKISDFEGKPILVESFAVWCSVCTNQQKNIKKLHEEVGDAVVSIAINPDPSEDFAIVQKHIDAHGFDWWYAVSPPDMTRALIDEFGTGIIQAQQAPIILVCEDQSARFLPRGLKNVEDLKMEISRGC